jgi:hypothetical protein
MKADDANRLKELVAVCQTSEFCDRLWTGTKLDRRSSHKPSFVAHSSTDHATWRRSGGAAWSPPCGRWRCPEQRPLPPLAYSTLAPPAPERRML